MKVPADPEARAERHSRALAEILHATGVCAGTRPDTSGVKKSRSLQHNNQALVGAKKTVRSMVKKSASGKD